MQAPNSRKWMPDIISQMPDLPGLALLVFVSCLAGVVRGFSGFGTAMIFLPMAALVLEPVWAVLALIGMDIFSPLPAVRRAARDSKWRDLGLLLAATAVMVPVGLWTLTQISPETYRYGVSAISLALVACLVLGLRYRSEPTVPLMVAAGGASGFLGGAAGLPGPPVIILYMASHASVARVRATTLLFLVGFDFLFLGTFFATGRFEPTPFLLGLCLGLPGAAGVWLGQLIFDPAREALYRNIAYGVVTCAALLGLPIWD